MPPKVDFVFFDAGGGHRAAATALDEACRSGDRTWRPNLVNLQEVLESADPFAQVTGIRLQDCYNLFLKRGWTLGSPQLLRLLQAGIALYVPKHSRMLAEFWTPDPPDMVVSLVPNLNRALFQGFSAANPGAPYITILTDLADYPPHFWMEKQDQWVICGSGQAVGQARELGLRPEKIRQVSGMILRPGFYEPVRLDRREARRRLGLDPDRPTGLLLFGGHGAGVMRDIARRLQSLAGRIQLICICGRNQRLAAQIRGIEGRLPIHVEEFTREIPYFMSLSDFFIGKPGPGSISEAIAMKLPVVVCRNTTTLPQERYNCDWVLENKVGVVLPGFHDIRHAVEELLEPGNLERYRYAAAAIDNRAVFEIPEILDEILASNRHPGG